VLFAGRGYFVRDLSFLLHRNFILMSFLARRVGSSVRWYSRYLQTTYNPASKLLKRPEFEPRSLFVIATPQHIDNLLTELGSISSEYEQLQIIAASTDSIPSGGTHRDGVSQMWLDEYITVNDSVRLEERDDNLEDNTGEESNGVIPVRANRPWKKMQTRLQVNLHNSDNGISTITTSLANSAFYFRDLCFMFYTRSHGADQLINANHNLAELTLTLPKQIRPTGFRSWNKLEQLSFDEDLAVTEHNHNLIKRINGQSAAGYLENCKRIMNLGSKDTKIFIELSNSSVQSEPRLYEVVAGGGGWGEKGKMLAISAGCEINTGDSVKFFMLHPEERYKGLAVPLDVQNASGLFVETTVEEKEYRDAQHEEERVIQNQFGFGSELGYTINGLQYNAGGSLTWIELE